MRIEQHTELDVYKKAFATAARLVLVFVFIRVAQFFYPDL